MGPTSRTEQLFHQFFFQTLFFKLKKSIKLKFFENFPKTKKFPKLPPKCPKGNFSKFLQFYLLKKKFEPKTRNKK
jgi:hypothetical protein